MAIIEGSCSGGCRDYSQKRPFLSYAVTRPPIQVGYCTGTMFGDSYRLRHSRQSAAYQVSDEPEDS